MRQDQGCMSRPVDAETVTWYTLPEPEMLVTVIGGSSNDGSGGAVIINRKSPACSGRRDRHRNCHLSSRSSCLQLKHLQSQAGTSCLCRLRLSASPRSCSVMTAVPLGATSSTRRSPIQACVMSTETETDVAVPESGTVMVSETVSMSGMIRVGERVCVNCPELLLALTLPTPPVLPEDRAKSDRVHPCDVLR